MIFETFDLAHNWAKTRELEINEGWIPTVERTHDGQSFKVIFRERTLFARFVDNTWCVWFEIVDGPTRIQIESHGKTLRSASWNTRDLALAIMSHVSKTINDLGG